MDSIKTKPKVFKIKGEEDEKSSYAYLFESTLPDDEAEAELKAIGYEVLDVSELNEKGN